MADTQDTHPPRLTEAQSVRENRDHQQQKLTTTSHPAALTRQRRALAELRRAKETARCRAREAAVARHDDTGTTDQQSNVRDHRGEVA